MNYLNSNKILLDILSSGNKTFIHLHSSKTYHTEELSALHEVSRDMVTKHSFGGICFDIESTSEYNTKEEIGNDYYMPVIESGLGEDLSDAYSVGLSDFSAPSSIGVLICTIDRPFLAYKSLSLFPHEMCRFDYMIVYHGWGAFRGSRYPFMDVFNKLNYTLSYEDDFIYIANTTI